MASREIELESVPVAGAAALIERARRVTIKIGSSLLIDPAGDGVRQSWLDGLGADIAELRGSGKQVVVVSSGAVALGRSQLGLGRGARLSVKQAAAAMGQPRLMHAWERAMAPAGILTAQLLLTLGDTESRRGWLNSRATMEVLLARGVLPVINENDSVATEELRYGDNDRLSARVAQMIQSDVLILLSDVDGVYTRDPRKSPDAAHIPRIEAITRDIEAGAAGQAANGVGSGGMTTKLTAARIAQAFNCATIIAAGLVERPLRELAKGARSTVIAAAGSPARAYKQWIAGMLMPAGALTIDRGAERAIASGGSLLPTGVESVAGRFERGDCVRVINPAGDEIARGLIGYNSVEAELIKGCASGDIPGRLGYSGPDELIHRGDLVLI